MLIYSEAYEKIMAFVEKVANAEYYTSDGWSGGYILSMDDVEDARKFLREAGYEADENGILRQHKM